MCQAYNGCHLKRRHDVRVEEQRYILFSSSASLLTVTDYKTFYLWVGIFQRENEAGPKNESEIGTANAELVDCPSRICLTGRT